MVGLYLGLMVDAREIVRHFFKASVTVPLAGFVPEPEQ
jgi:hypothetical protein